MAVIGPEGDSLPVGAPEPARGEDGKGPDYRSESVMGLIARPLILICRIPIVIIKPVIRLICGVFRGSARDDDDSWNNMGGANMDDSQPTY